MDQRRVVLVMRRRRNVRRVLQLNLPTFDHFIASSPPAAYFSIRFRILCQNQLLTPAQRQPRNIPAIALDADELTFDTWMTCLRETSRTRCDQCGHIPSERIRETDLEYHAALRETATCHHSICVFCLREKFKNVMSTIRCYACSQIWLINSASTPEERREFRSQ